MALLEVKDLVKDFNDDGVLTKVLHGISLQVEEKEFVAVMGASGSGKSTLMHILGLLDRPTSGRYLLHGLDTTVLSDQELALTRNKEIGFVFQAFHLLPRLTLVENVMVPLYYSAVPKSEWQGRAERALGRVGLAHRLAFHPTQLSGGERQRTAIARALILDPKLILADEPTGNLDSKNGQAILDLMVDLNKAGHTIVLVTHDAKAGHTAKRILTMQDGQIISDEVVSSAPPTEPISQIHHEHH